MRKILFILFFTLLFLQIVSAVEFNMNTEFDQGETLIAKISGNFIEPPAEEDIFFYRGHVKIPLDYQFGKMNEEFYIFALLKDKTPNNYSISIENIKYYQGPIISEENIVKNFSISNNTADFSVDPGFITSSEDFYLEVQNLKDSTIEITTKTTFKDDQTITVSSGEIKNIKISIDNINESVLEIINLSSENNNYEIFSYIIANKTSGNSLSTNPSNLDDEPEESFKFEPSKINWIISTGSLKTIDIFLYNDGGKTLEEIGFFLSNSLKDIVSVSTEKIDKLKKEESARIKLTIISEEAKKIDGELRVITKDNLETSLNLSLEFILNYNSTENEPPKPIDPSATEQCAKLGGSICDVSNNESCPSTSVPVKDESCCLAECLENKEDNSGKIIGWLLVFLVLIFGYYFYKKSKGKTSKKIGFFKKK